MILGGSALFIGILICTLNSVFERAGQKHHQNLQTLLSHRQAWGLWLCCIWNSSVPMCSPWRQNINTGQLLWYFIAQRNHHYLSIGAFLGLLVERIHYPLTCFQGRTLSKLSHICFVQLVQHVMLCSHEFWSYSDVQQRQLRPNFIIHLNMFLLHSEKTMGPPVANLAPANPHD